MVDLSAGVETIRGVAADWPPERVAEVTSIGAQRIRELARELAATPNAVVYGRIGLCNQEFGSLASWLVDVVNILTGLFDTPGGSMFSSPGRVDGDGPAAARDGRRRREPSGNGALNGIPVSVARA